MSWVDSSANSFGCVRSPKPVTLSRKIVREELVFDADGSENAEFSCRETYWEAWRVVAGVVMSVDGVTPLADVAHDTWGQRVKRKQRAGRYGRWSMTGTVYWLEDGAAELRGFRENSVASAGCMLATRSDPGITGAPVLTHVRSDQWDARSVEAALGVLKQDAKNDVPAADANDAMDELMEYGFAKEIAADAVKQYTDGGGRFE